MSAPGSYCVHVPILRKKATPMQLVARNWFRDRFARPARNSDEHGVRVRVVVEAVRASGHRPVVRLSRVASCPYRVLAGRPLRVAERLAWPACSDCGTFEKGASPLHLGRIHWTSVRGRGRREAEMRADRREREAKHESKGQNAKQACEGFPKQVSRKVPHARNRHILKSILIRHHRKEQQLSCHGARADAAAPRIAGRSAPRCRRD